MPRQDRMSLKTIDFNPTPFQPVQFQAVAPEVSILANAFARQEEREQKAAESIGKANEVFANMRSQLHQDAQTMDWFTKFQNEKLQQLYDLQDLDPDEVIKKGTMLGAEVANNAELQGRMRNNQELNEENKKLDERKDIDDVTKRRFKKQNEDAFQSTPQLNEAGEVIGTYKWTPAEEPVADINPLDLAVFVSKIVAPEETSSTTQRGGKTINADGTGREYTTMDGRTIHVLTEKRLHEVYDKVEQAYPGYDQALTQAYNNEFFRLDEIDDQLRTATGSKRISLENEKQRIKRRLYTDEGAGIQRTPEEYRDYQLGVVLDEMAYRNTDTKNVRESGVDNQAGGDSGSGTGGFSISGWPAGFGNSYFPLRTAGTVNMNFGRTGLQSSNYLYNAVSGGQQVLTLKRGDVFSLNGQYYQYGNNGSQPIAAPGKTELKTK